MISEVVFGALFIFNGFDLEVVSTEGNYGDKLSRKRIHLAVIPPTEFFL